MEQQKDPNLFVLDHFERDLRDDIKRKEMKLEMLSAIRDELKGSTNPEGV